jgi:uncharacterized protein YndB with AHSA1/START domain
MSDTKMDRWDLAERTEAPFGPSSLNISASVPIGAEVQRILYALATPEYMEAWLQLPEVDRVECHSERRSFDRFRIDLLSAGKRQQSILGSCLLSKPNKITYLWEKDHGGSRVRSTVEIYLLGGPTGCILKLKHSGFVSQDDREWHSAMWHRSLGKLCSLVEGTGITHYVRDHRAFN